jgi:asparagine synthase (glutamine-hydrolysing)
MCGILGVFNLDGRPADPFLLRRMIGRIAHRGPDGIGIHVAGPLGLAHARLSIIDLEGGRQPMASLDRSASITFNGEIFNYVELRARLEAQGHVFATSSDTEVILEAYRARGEACVQDFNGQWAFGLWDARRRRLLLSRDRLGVRPLFHARVGRTLLFASEIKALLAHPEVPRELDLRGLDEVFTVWHPVAPRTVFRGVEELPPGHSMTVDATGEVRLTPHWRLEYPVDPVAPRDPDQAAEELRELLLDATRIRLRADVPVGAYLSGGLDSTSVTALARRAQGAPRTFSVTFDDPEFDERRFQAEAVRALGTVHEDVACRPADIAAVFPDVVRHVETPIVRTAPAPLYVLAGLVRARGYKVVLTGEGADEMLGGYDLFKEAKIRRFWASVPGSRRRPALLRRLYPWLPNLQKQPDAYLQAFFHVRAADLASPFFAHLPRWRLTAGLKRFFAPAVRAALAPRDLLAELREHLPMSYGRWPTLCQAQYVETTGLLPGYILSSQGDRVAMAHGVELRSPFLDHRVVRFAAGLPPALKLRVLDEKHVLKRAMAGIVPATIRARAKQPYRAPEGRCFVEPRLPDYVEALLAPDRLARDGVFDPVAVDQLVRKFRAGRAVGIRDNMALVAILSTQLVIHHFLGAPPERLEHGADPARASSVHRH